METYRDLPYNDVQDFADENGLNIDTEENYREAAIMLFNRKDREVTYHRGPTQGEIKFGEGAIHYKDFDVCFCWNDAKNKPKAWLKCPVDGLRYYY